MTNRFDRQGFLGTDSARILKQATVGLVGLGGGGSHVVQQLAHLGIGGYVLVDPDIIEESNTNRLVGGTLDDVRHRTPKVAIARRAIESLVTDARVMAIQDAWLHAAEFLKRCDVIIGAVDTFKDREQLERFARRHLIPYIDVGMDVHDVKGRGFLISGQVIRSMPGHPCLRCCGLLTDERLTHEAQAYGAAGGAPQVVWPNGILASTAVGLLVQLFTPWSEVKTPFIHLEYDGNQGTMKRSARMELLQGHDCPHHPASETGDSLFDIRTHSNISTTKPLQPTALEKDNKNLCADPQNWLQRIFSWIWNKR